jgi:hypothetical protein
MTDFCGSVRALGAQRDIVRSEKKKKFSRDQYVPIIFVLSSEMQKWEGTGYAGG